MFIVALPSPWLEFWTLFTVLHRIFFVKESILNRGIEYSKRALSVSHIISSKRLLSKKLAITTLTASVKNVHDSRIPWVVSSADKPDFDIIPVLLVTHTCISQIYFCMVHRILIENMQWIETHSRFLILNIYNWRRWTQARTASGLLALFLRNKQHRRIHNLKYSENVYWIS